MIENVKLDKERCDFWKIEKKIKFYLKIELRKKTLVLATISMKPKRDGKLLIKDGNLLLKPKYSDMDIFLKPQVQVLDFIKWKKTKRRVLKNIKK